MKQSCVKHAGLVLIMVLCTATLPVWAADPLVFENETQERRFQELTEQLRCLVCQNQNLAGSDAPLAQDLRQEIHDMLLAGQSDDEIRKFLVDRYGEFVLYKPPMSGNTLLLWLTPLLLLLVGSIVVFVNIRKHRLTDHDQSIPANEES